MGAGCGHVGAAGMSGPRACRGRRHVGGREQAGRLGKRNVKQEDEGLYFFGRITIALQTKKKRTSSPSFI